MILRALFLASLAIFARFSIYVSFMKGGFGDGSIVTCLWLLSVCVIMGWVCQLGLFFIMYMAFRIR